MNDSLTILMPCLNEEQTIGICIQKALSFLKKSNLNGEILVVDNGSSDNSVVIIKSFDVNSVEEIFNKGHFKLLVKRKFQLGFNNLFVFKKIA